MKQNRGFLFLEVGLALLIVSFLSAVIAKTMGQIVCCQSEIRTRIEAINGAINVCEHLRQDPHANPPSSNCKVTIKKNKLKSAGRWSIDLTNEERERLCSMVEWAVITVEWIAQIGQKRLYQLVTVLSDKR